MQWQAILVDRDGTLFDSLPVIIQSFNYAIEPYTEKRLTDADWYKIFGPPELEVLGTVVGESKEQAYMRFLRYYMDHYPEVELIRGVRDLLEHVKQAGVKPVLLTGAGRESTGWSLAWHGILHLFDLLVTGDDVRKTKPDPEGVKLAIDKLRLKPERTLVVGDAGSDIKAGKGAGAKTALARWASHSQPARVRGADFVFKTIGEFHKFLFNGK